MDQIDLKDLIIIAQAMPCVEEASLVNNREISDSLLFIKSVSIRVNALGSEHTDTQKTIQGLIETYEKLNQPKKADEYRAMLINSNGSSSSGGCLLRQEHG